MTSKVFYNYEYQCWVEDGLVADCGHSSFMACDCYGRSHTGEPLPPKATNEQEESQ